MTLEESIDRLTEELAKFRVSREERLQKLKELAETMMEKLNLK